MDPTLSFSANEASRVELLLRANEATRVIINIIKGGKREGRNMLAGQRCLGMVILIYANLKSDLTFSKKCHTAQSLAKVFLEQRLFQFP